MFLISWGQILWILISSVGKTVWMFNGCILLPVNKMAQCRLDSLNGYMHIFIEVEFLEEFRLEMS